ncbi:MAG: SusD/RagB family nutrient-binding outer membrane lipoprotein, partial [Prevotella shahii]|nr:SusD/RagB family nutrient-binding outer membrane lipoprotein [Hoylesella shahii]
MKNIKYIAMASLFAFGLTACGDFGDTNIDGEHLNSENVPYEMLFSSAQHQVLGSDWDLWRTGCIYSAQWTQQLSSIGWWTNYARYLWNEGYSASVFYTFSGDRGALRNVTTCYDLWKDNADMQIDWNIARVLRVYAFAKMSDLYGDIPYSEAGRPEQFSYP